MEISSETQKLLRKRTARTTCACLARAKVVAAIIAEFTMRRRSAHLWDIAEGCATTACQITAKVVLRVAAKRMARPLWERVIALTKCAAIVEVLRRTIGNLHIAIAFGAKRARVGRARRRRGCERSRRDARARGRSAAAAAHCAIDSAAELIALLLAVATPLIKDALRAIGAAADVVRAVAALERKARPAALFNKR